MKYYGYTNWATWNVAHWFGDDEPLYRSVQHATTAGRWDAISAEDHVRGMLPNGTLDMDCGESERGAGHYEDVDWQEIADAWNNGGR